MEQLIKYLIYAHIFGGAIALISGTVSMIVKKGSNMHRLAGKLFFYAMILVSISAIFVASNPGHENLFLFIIGVFSAYLVSSGYRILYLKKLHKGMQPQFIDWIISLTMGGFVVFFIYLSIASMLKNDFSAGTILFVFGGIGAYLVVRDIKCFLKPPADKNFWLYQHIVKMIAGNIAAFTAFLVVNNKILPPVVAWLGPTVIGIVLIRSFTGRYKSKTKEGKKLKEFVTIKIREKDLD